MESRAHQHNVRKNHLSKLTRGTKSSGRIAYTQWGWYGCSCWLYFEPYRRLNLRWMNIHDSEVIRLNSSDNESDELGVAVLPE